MQYLFIAQNKSTVIQNFIKHVVAVAAYIRLASWS